MEETLAVLAIKKPDTRMDEPVRVLATFNDETIMELPRSWPVKNMVDPMKEETLAMSRVALVAVNRVVNKIGVVMLRLAPTVFMVMVEPASDEVTE